MRRITLALLLISTPAFAAMPVSGHAALAMGAITGSLSPALSAAQKKTLLGLLNGNNASGPPITISADEIRCQAGNVAITHFRCALRFGGKTVNLTGRAAHELFATLGEIGIDDDGAAGSVFRAAKSLTCKLDIAAIAQNDGSGADCRYDPD